MNTPLLRRAVIALFAVLLLGVSLGACGDDSTSAADAESTSDTAAAAKAAGNGLDPDNPVKLVIGVPRSFGWFSTLLVRDVQIPGVEIEYKFFPVFGDLLAALNAGQIDLTELGDIGAIQSYVNGGGVQVVAVTDPNPKQAGLLVKKDSGIETTKDLKGKKVAFLKSTNSYPAILHILEEAGLSESDIEVVQVTGPDATRAFEAGEIDVRSNIDPDMADTVDKLDATILTDFEGYGENLYPYVATTKALEEKPEAIRAAISAVADNIAWAQENPDEQAELLAPKLGFGEAAIKTGYARGAKRLQPIDDEFFESEQAAIDEYLELGIITKELDVRDLFITDFNDAIEGSKP